MSNHVESWIRIKKAKQEDFVPEIELIAVDDLRQLLQTHLLVPKKPTDGQIEAICQALQAIVENATAKGAATGTAAEKERIHSAIALYEAAIKAVEQ